MVSFNNLLDYSEYMDGYVNIQLDSISPDQRGMSNLTSLQLSKMMIPGWNAGSFTKTKKLVLLKKKEKI